MPVQDMQIVQVAPDVMSDIHGTIEKVFLHLGAAAPTDPYLKKLHEMAQSVKRIISYAKERGDDYSPAY